MRLAQQLTVQEHNHMRDIVRLSRWEGFVFGFVAGGIFAVIVAAALMVMR